MFTLQNKIERWSRIQLFLDVSKLPKLTTTATKNKLDKVPRISSSSVQQVLMYDLLKMQKTACLGTWWWGESDEWKHSLLLKANSKSMTFFLEVFIGSDHYFSCCCILFVIKKSVLISVWHTQSSHYKNKKLT